MGIVDEFFGKAAPTEIKNDFDDLENMGKDTGIIKTKEPARIGVHCVAGLGRAPLLVALGLVYGGMEPCNAVDLIKK